MGADNPVTTADLVAPAGRGVVKLGIWLRKGLRLWTVLASPCRGEASDARRRGPRRDCIGAGLLLLRAAGALVAAVTNASRCCSAIWATDLPAIALPTTDSSPMPRRQLARRSRRAAVVGLKLVETLDVDQVGELATHDAQARHVEPFALERGERLGDRVDLRLRVGARCA